MDAPNPAPLPAKPERSEKVDNPFPMFDDKIIILGRYDQRCRVRCPDPSRAGYYVWCEYDVNLLQDQHIKGEHLTRTHSEKFKVIWTASAADAVTFGGTAEDQAKLAKARRTIVEQPYDPAHEVVADGLIQAPNPPPGSKILGYYKDSEGRFCLEARGHEFSD